jgi:hypothetical protein
VISLCCYRLAALAEIGVTAAVAYDPADLLAVDIAVDTQVIHESTSSAGKALSRGAEGLSEVHDGGPGIPASRLGMSRGYAAEQ